MDKVNVEEEGLINRKQNKDFSACKNYIPVIVEPYPQTKLKKIDDNKWLFNKDSTLYPVMYKIHEVLNGAKNMYFYVKRQNGRYALLKHENKLQLVFKKYKSNDGFLHVYYHNDMINRSKLLDYCFYFAQIVIVFYLVLFIYGYLKMHEYI
ncbi:unnamed protein product [Paramecium sonneborni]|uniref:Uncharacterized protein n=1 Tax=Paramecium sonneborni TaxID=65129 RepID=A0A8S1JXD4_9CILI|nr:unnamed protein product [Paramecium sonneborni]